MPTRETGADIDDAAAQWAARVDRAPLAPAETNELEAWLAGDVRRRGAFARAQAVLAHLDRAKALGPQYDADQFRTEKRSAGPSRRMVAGGAAIGALAAGLGAVLLFQPQRLQTRRGEVRLATLADGSVVTLNTDTEIEVRFTQAARRIALVRGEALFNVAKNPARPFVVEAAGASVRAVGTSFTVRRLSGEGVKVLVREGVVEVRSAQATAAAPLRLVANTGAYAPAGAGFKAEPVSAEEVGRQLAWREGMIAFNGETLKEAAAEFARYNDQPILIDDPDIGGRTITGLFSAGNPAAFANAAAISLNLQTSVDDQGVHLRK